jgi:hypothetical protein
LTEPQASIVLYQSHISRTRDSNPKGQPSSPESKVSFSLHRVVNCGADTWQEMYRKGIAISIDRQTSGRRASSYEPSLVRQQTLKNGVRRTRAIGIPISEVYHQCTRATDHLRRNHASVMSRSCVSAIRKLYPYCLPCLPRATTCCLVSAETNKLMPPMVLEGSMTQVEAFALCCGTCFAGIWYPMVYSSGGGDMKEHARTRSHLALISTSDAFVRGLTRNGCTLRRYCRR